MIRIQRLSSSAKARRPARPIVAAVVAMAVGAAGAAGCRQQDPPLERQRVPSADSPDAPRVRSDVRRPLPPDAQFDELGFQRDPPLFLEPPPEAVPFVQAYDAVGRPKIMVFVNRTLEGAIVPTTEERILEGRRRVIETTGAADVERTERSDTYREQGGYYGGRYGERHTERGESLSTTGPARIEDRTELYLPPGEYDEIWAKRIDYSALENALADALAVRGEVTVLSPQLVRERMSPEEVAALQAGRPAVLQGLAQRLGADVLVQVQARPTAQTAEGLDLRIVAEALNTLGGESIGRANADFSGPMSAARLDDVSRYLARRLMDDMTGAWIAPPPRDGPEGAPPATQPQTQPER